MKSKNNRQQKLEAFGKLLDEINDAIDVAKIDYAMSGILSKGRAGFEKQKEEYKKNAKNKSAETQKAASPQPVQTTSQTNTSTNSAEPEKEIHAVNGKFTSEFMKLSNCYVVDFTVNSRVFKIYFREVPDDLRTVQELGQDVTINIYQFGDKFIFDSLL